MIRSITPLLVVAVLSVAVALMTLRVAFLGLPMSFTEMPEHISQRRLAFILHIFPASIALGLGALQFFPRLRVRRPAVHRWSGRIYAAAILAGGVSGFIIALEAKGGLSVSLGFGILSVLWIAITTNAVRLAMAGRVADHRRWMIRSFALTFAAVTLRLYLIGFIAAGFSYTEASPYLAWICWVPNLMFAEWMIRRV